MTSSKHSLGQGRLGEIAGVKRTGRERVRGVRPVGFRLGWAEVALADCLANRSRLRRWDRERDGGARGGPLQGKAGDGTRGVLCGGDNGAGVVEVLVLVEVVTEVVELESLLSQESAFNH